MPCKCKSPPEFSGGLQKIRQLSGRFGHGRANGSDDRHQHAAADATA
jgi:hypothetical protein